jgi:hypothetical protein
MIDENLKSQIIHCKRRLEQSLLMSVITFLPKHLGAQSASFSPTIYMVLQLHLSESTTMGN